MTSLGLAWPIRHASPLSCLSRPLIHNECEGLLGGADGSPVLQTSLEVDLHLEESVGRRVEASRGRHLEESGRVWKSLEESGRVWNRSQSRAAIDGPHPR